MAPPPQHPGDSFRRHGALAAAVVRQADDVIDSPRGPGGRHAAAVWSAAKARSDLWSSALTGLLEAAEAAPLGPRREAAAIALAADVLSAEVLTRLWAATLAARDRRRGGRLTPVAESLLGGHMRCRGLALRLMTHPTALRRDFVDELDALRRRVERWTDCLLAALPGDAAMSPVGRTPVAFDAGRCRDFAEDAEHWRRVGPGGWPLAELSLRIGTPVDAPAGRHSRGFHEAVADAIARASVTPPRPKPHESASTVEPSRLDFRRMFPRF